MRYQSIEEMKNVDVRSVAPEELVDLGSVHVDTELPREERIKSFLAQIGNPYCYKCGKVIVKVSFLDTDVTLEDRLEHYIRGL